MEKIVATQEDKVDVFVGGIIVSIMSVYIAIKTSLPQYMPTEFPWA